MKLTLGQDVTVNEHLFRAEATAEQVLKIAETWPHTPERIVEQAKKDVSRNAERKERDAWFHSMSPMFSMWLPVRLSGYTSDTNIGWLPRKSRQHPVDTYLELPVDGIVVRQVQLQDGIAGHGEYGSEWNQLSSRIGYHIGFHLNRRHLVVLPHMLEVK